MVGLAFSNSPAAMSAAGGSRPLFGTNPVAAIFPRPAPLVIDLSLSQVARGKLMVAAKAGKAIPEGWALDKSGVATTDPAAALEGSMLPMGGSKGAMLALVVELLVTALTGAALGFEASSFFVDEGNRPRLGQAFLVIDPGALGGQDVYAERVETLIAAMSEEPAVRLPGARRHALYLEAERTVFDVPAALWEELGGVHRLQRLSRWPGTRPARSALAVAALELFLLEQQVRAVGVAAIGGVERRKIFEAAPVGARA